MNILEIISAILLIMACVFIVAVVLMQDTKQGMSQTISGGSADNYYQKNSGRSKEAQLKKATKFFATLFFVIALAVNIVSAYSGSGDTGTSSPNTSTSAVVGDSSSKATVGDSSSNTSGNTTESTNSTSA